ncbi:hypothetical protein V6N12_058935 [Hibiscus sabdariffa]|uniref:Tetratricopeptide repeat protein n=1 Tax=Hibiscus sabdariffa TaxID=183260 RepID=A0ABR2ETK7_9ROSI
MMTTVRFDPTGKLSKFSSSPTTSSPMCWLKFMRSWSTVLLKRAFRSAWQRAATVHEKLVFGAWLKYEKQEEERIVDLLATCNKCAQEFGPVDVVSQLQVELNGYFTGSFSEDIDLSENNISPLGIGQLFLQTNFCSERLQDACDRKLASLVCTKDDAVEFMEYAIEQNYPILAASCLQVFLHDLPDCLNDERLVGIFSHADRQQRLIMVGQASFSLYCLLSEVAMNLDPQYDTTICFLEQLIAETDKERLLAFHQLGCVRLLRKEYDEAESLLERAEQSLYCEGDLRWEDLEKATELDPTLTYPYRYRAASLMMKQNVEAAIAEINRVLGFKLALECLELQFFLYLAIEDYKAAIHDVQAILTVSPDYRMFEG